MADTIVVKRTSHRFLPDPRRVLAKPFSPGDEMILPGPSRTAALIHRILAIPETDVGPLLRAILHDFSPRHRAFEDILERHFELVAHHMDSPALLSRDHRLLVGAYFTHEYSVEAAALFNPSIVVTPELRQGLPGAMPFVMSLRAVGEGHLSSIEFRTGLVDADGELTFDPPGSVLVGGHRTPPSRYDKRAFAAKIAEVGGSNEIADGVFGRLGERFSSAELDASLHWLEEHGPPPAIWFETVKIMRTLASSNYVATFPADSAISERVIFPAGPNETRGMEDARFVRFLEDDGRVRYYATYTAYDGFSILPQLIETEDFRTFRISTLNGVAAQNKGMALFPRRIDGRYVMLSRRDRENLHLATSTDLRLWNEATELYRPSEPWELTQLGNCGSPLETDAGWLVLTHGVGPMRQYALGAILLDRDDPHRILGRLREPLLLADTTERDGYVPNVVYTCGALAHGDVLVLPYGASDSVIAVATVSLRELLGALRAP
jgi:predicted GH43/DUF377 family glycosyl hydrolase